MRQGQHCRQPHPGLGVFRVEFDGIFEMRFCAEQRLARAFRQLLSTERIFLVGRETRRGLLFDSLGFLVTQYAVQSDHDLASNFTLNVKEVLEI